MNYAGIAFILCVMLFPGIVALIQRSVVRFVCRSEGTAKAYTVTRY